MYREMEITLHFDKVFVAQSLKKETLCGKMGTRQVDRVEIL